ncbi:MAG: hypothetical protein CME70_15995 [Halobacteriovorax sp.]|nr:hypothetical protein [Halobacteriovorax sp.]|tara:strand:- start:64745 stop:65032 length:288 start_codon:yes stop_codon:yes gene_type:complete
MKKLIMVFALLATTSLFAETVTGVHTLFSRISQADVEAKMMDAVEDIKRGRLRPHNCSSRAKVYAAGVNGMSYRVNRHGELEKQWTAYVKYSCRD